MTERLEQHDGKLGEWSQWKVAIERATKRYVPGEALRIDAGGNCPEDHVARNLLATWEQVHRGKCPGDAEQMNRYVRVSVSNRARSYARDRWRHGRQEVVEWEEDCSSSILGSNIQDAEQYLTSKISVQRLQAHLDPEQFTLLLKFAERGRIKDAYDPKYGSLPKFYGMMHRLIARARQIVEGTARC